MSTQQKEQTLDLITDDILKETKKRLEQSKKNSKLKNLVNRPAAELYAENSRTMIRERIARFVPDRARRAIPTETLRDDVALERILGSNDLVDIRFLLRGAALSSAIARINLPRGFATGFVVAPGVLMTNWHVFKRVQDARNAAVEFGFRELVDGRITTPTTYNLDTDRLFFHNRDHDVAIVAIGARQSGTMEMDEIPFCPLNGRESAVINGDRLNIIQHPAGEPKQIALRDNTVFAIPDETFLQYRADTRRGSSGSPVFNDEWEVVGLHHSGVPNVDKDGNILALNGSLWRRHMGDDQIDWIANEAIQSSAIIRLFNTLNFTGEAADLLESILDPPPRNEIDRSLPTPARKRNGVEGKRQPTLMPSSQQVENGVAKITVPVEISVRIPDMYAGTSSNGQLNVESEFTTEELEAIGHDPEYRNRNGYSPVFMELSLPMPKLTREQRMKAAINRQATSDDDQLVLDYHNFSLIMNAERRLIFFTAVNIDGKNLIRISRKKPGGKAKWITDPRIGPHEQADNRFYKGRQNRLDRGHLVRRLDPAWGDSREQAARGIIDSFHYTNCAPQYDRFNRTDGADGLWLGLENFVLDNAEMDDMRVCVFSGPVFRHDDPDFKDNGLKIPRQYWKIVAWCDQDELQTAAFLLSQESLLDRDFRIEDLPSEAFDFRTRKLFQTTVDEISDLTELDFGPLHNVVTESAMDRVEIVSQHDIMV